MKRLTETINNWLADFSERLEVAILNKEFKKIEENAHIVTIEVLGEIVEIWNVENQSTHFYAIHTRTHGLGLIYTQGLFGKFKKSKTCRKILREDTKEMIEKRNKEIDKQIKELQKLKETK